MPRLNDNDDLQTFQIGGNFNFQGARIANLGATEYTLVTIAVDVSGSVAGFKKELRQSLVTAVDACRKSPRSDNILLRVVTFPKFMNTGVEEMHGFKPLSDVDPAAYPDLNVGGGTPLCDACYSAIGAINSYGEQLSDQDFGVNGIAFIITDGGENTSKATMKMVRDEAQRSVSGEILESMITVLVGINASALNKELERFRREAGLTQYIDAGDATPKKLAKLADFVSQSVSSQSQALGTGGPSRNIAAVI